MENIQDISGKRILLHACCGPCSLGAIEPLLSDGAMITLFYYNPCIFGGEFEKRYVALKTVADNYGIELVMPQHDHDSFLAYAEGKLPEEEGGPRCRMCMSDRLKAAAVYAQENGFDMYTTTLTVSPHKNTKLIFSLAEKIAEDGVTIPFLARDFKKKNGFLLSCTLSRELGIYRQRFCGCEMSAKQAGIDVSEYSAMVKAEYANLEALRSEEW